MADGILLIDKPEGITSFDVVARVRRLYGTKKVGHTGTLDPLATGLLCLLIGRAVKASEYLVEKDKTYKAGLRLGLVTDTEDITGKILSESDAIPSREAVLETANAFRGDILQVPPMYSALKVGGKKLVDLAREGITVMRLPRPITVYSLDIDGENRDYSLLVHCSKGTYIRTLCADMGNALGCGGVMSSLRRLTAGAFSLQNAVTLDALEAMPLEKREALLLPTEALFSELPKVTLPPFFERLSRSGCEIYQKKINTHYPVGERLRVYGAEGFYALGEVRDYPEGTAIKILKAFG